MRTTFTLALAAAFVMAGLSYAGALPPVDKPLNKPDKHCHQAPPTCVTKYHGCHKPPSAPPGWTCTPQPYQVCTPGKLICTNDAS